MTTAPDDFMVRTALDAAAKSPCRSKRGVALFDMHTGAFRGAGFNGPPALLGCLGREKCAGNCGQRAVHAEVRALREAAVYLRNGHPPGPYDLIHVELAPGPVKIEVARSADGLSIGQAPHVVTGPVVACGGPSCLGCAAQILDAGFVGGVWLYQRVPPRGPCGGGWPGGVHRYMDGDREVLCPVCGGAGYRVPATAVWVRRSVEDFYRQTLSNCGLVP